MFKSLILRHCKKTLAVLLASLLTMLAGCTHYAIDDCPKDEVLGEDKARIRSSHFRMFLADIPAASERFIAQAAMSSLAYAEDQDCGTLAKNEKVSAVDRVKFEKVIKERGWNEIRKSDWIPPCEDSVGLYLRVWERSTDLKKEVTIAFRGTWGGSDWFYGNAYWLTRFLPMDNQYDRARAAMAKIINHFDEQTQGQVHYYTTGHSLGGGLAQHSLYANPKKVIQAIAFDPSPATGFTSQSADKQVAGCACSNLVPDGEPRIYRVYDSYEILSFLRIFHKTFFLPERHIQEVRFPHDHSHSMLGLTEYFIQNAKNEQAQISPWFKGEGELSAESSCTSAFIESQMGSCSKTVSENSWSKCPQ